MTFPTQVYCMNFYVLQKKVALVPSASIANLFPGWIITFVRSLMLAHIKITIWSSKKLLIVLRAVTKLKQHQAEFPKLYSNIVGWKRMFLNGHFQYLPLKKIHSLQQINNRIQNHGILLMHSNLNLSPQNHIQIRLKTC